MGFRATQDEQVLFHERQPLHQNLIIRVVMPLETIVIGGVLLPLAYGPGRAQWVELVLLFIALGVALPLWLCFVTLETVVTDRRLVIRYRPFPGRDVDAASITAANAVTYHPIGDAGGWGWRISTKFHRVFNVSGNRGVYVRHGEGRRDRFMVGSRRADELAEAIGLARFAATESGPAGLVSPAVAPGGADGPPRT